MTNINEQISQNEQINLLETELGIKIPGDFKKCLQKQLQEQLIGKCFYHGFYGSPMVSTITCIFSVSQLLSRLSNNTNRTNNEYLHIGIAGGNNLVISLKNESYGKIFVLCGEEYYRQVAEGFNNFVISLISKDTALAKDIG